MARIFLIEDEGAVRAQWRTMLQAHGHDVIEAEAGEDVIARCAADCPDLVVLNLILSGKDGLEVLMWIRKLPQAPRILAIAGTFLKGYDVRESARLLGVCEILTKPVDDDLFLHRIEALLSGG